MEPEILKENIVGIKNHYVISKQRSGSTLLAFMLANNSEVQVVHEENVFFKFRTKYKNVIFNNESIIQQFIEDIYKFPTHKVFVNNYLPSRETVESTLKTYCNYNLTYKDFCNLFNLLFFDKYKNNKVNTIINKDIIYQVSVTEIHRENPEAKFVFLIRDSVFNINSHIKRDFGTSNIVGQAYIWNNLMNDFYACTKKLPKENYLIVKYEDLINDTGSEMMKICEVFNLPFQKSVLDHRNTAQIIFDFAKQRMIEQGVAEKDMPEDKIHVSTRGEINKNIVFEHGFTNNQVKKINFITNKNRIRFGYATEKRNFKDISLITAFELIFLMKKMVKFKIYKFYFQSNYYFKVFFRKINVFKFFN